MRVPPARTIPINATSTDVALMGGASLLTFYNFTEATGSAGAKVRLYDGTGTNGALMASVTLTAAQSTRDLIPLPGILARVGLFLEVVSGEIEGAVWLVPETLIAPYALTQGVEEYWSGDE